MSFLFFIIFIIFLFIVIILFSVLGVIRSILSTIFGIGRRKNNYQTEPNQQYNPNNSNHNDHKTKVFEPTEGEYVDYEEIKDK